MEGGAAAIYRGRGYLPRLSMAEDAQPCTANIPLNHSVRNEFDTYGYVVTRNGIGGAI